MIKAFCGRFGSGKTLSMVNEALFWLKNDVTIVTNTPFYYHYYQLFNVRKAISLKKFGEWRTKKPILVTRLEDYFRLFKTATNTIFIMDEAGIWLDSYKWNKIDDEVYNRFFQVRKVNIHLLYTTQFFNFVVKKLRQMTDVVVECSVPIRLPPSRNIPYATGTPIIVRNIYYNPLYYEQKIWSLEVEKKFIDYRRFIWGIDLQHTFNAFDTKKLIQ